MTAPVLQSAAIVDTSHSGTAQAGASTTVTLASGASSTDDFYNGCRIEITGGTGIYQTRWITDYNGTTKVATINTAWDNTVDATSTYDVQSGRVLSLTFDVAATYQSGSATVVSSPIIGTTSNRQIDTVGSPVRGNGTTTVYFQLPKGKPINSGETVTVNLPAALVDDGSGNNNALSTGTSVTNNSQYDASPICRLAIMGYQLITGSSFELEAQAFGVFGEGDGISQVVFELDDGVTQNTSSAITTRSASSIDGHRVFVGSVSTSGLNSGLITAKATATSNCGLGTRQHTLTFFYDSGDQQSNRYYAATTGDDSTGAGTSGNPYRNIRQCVVAARSAGDDYCYIELMDAGNFIIGGGQIGGGRYAGMVYVEAASGLTADEPVIIPDHTNTGNEIDGEYMDSNYRINVDGCTINPSNPTDASELFLIRRINLANGILDCGATIARVTSQTSTATECDMMSSTVRNAISTGGWPRMRNVEIVEVDGDVLPNIEMAVNVRVTGGRKYGSPAFTVSATGVGTATITKTTGQVSLSDDNGIQNIDITAASNDTLAELVATINGRTGWTCTQLLDSAFDGYNADGDNSTTNGILNFSAVTVSGGAQTIYISSSIHSDLIQFFGTSYSNIMIDGVRDQVAYGLPGSSTGQQVYWLDHAGPLGINGAAFLNVSSAQFDPNPNTPRTGIHGRLRNIVMAFNSIADRRMNFLYAGGGTANSDFVPRNFTLAHNLEYNFIIESTGPSSSDATDMYVDNNHVIDSGNADFTGTNSTGGSISSEVATYTDVDNYDLTPSSGGNLVSRISSGIDWNGFGDAEGTLRATDGTGAIGAYEGTGASSQTYPEAPHSIRQLIRTARRVYISLVN